MATFDIAPLERFQGVQTSIKRPKEVAHFSFDDQHVLKTFSDESLSYYYPPIFNTPHGEGHGHNDLSEGFETFNQHDDSQDGHLDGLLDTMMELEQREDRRCKVDVVTWRGMMTKVRSILPHV